MDLLAAESIGLPRLSAQRSSYHIRSKPTHEKQYEQDDQDEADNAHAAVTEAIAVPAEAAAEATKQKPTRRRMSISPIDMIHLPFELPLNPLGWFPYS